MAMNGADAPTVLVDADYDPRCERDGGVALAVADEWATEGKAPPADLRQYCGAGR